MEKRIQDNKIQHMHNVAEYMYQNASKNNLNPDEMYFLGLCHDIGYINGKQNHEITGSNLLYSLGLPQKIYEAIKYHGITPTEYKKIFNCSDNEIPKTLILLWDADMHINKDGENVGYEKRLEDIGSRLGYESKAYKNSKEIIEWLKNKKES